MRLDRELKDAAEGDERSCADPVRVEHVPLEVISGLGQGGYAVVVLVRSTNAENHGNPDFFAMKVIEKSKVAKKRSISRLKMELRAMTELPPSRFLQRCHMAFESQTNIFFVLDYNAGGDLFFHLVDRIKKGQEGFFEHEARVILAETVLGICHLHQNKFIHRDIKVSARSAYEVNIIQLMSTPPINYRSKISCSRQEVMLSSWTLGCADESRERWNHSVQRVH